ncbi:MAG: N-acetylmuramoyl-L-alanine amidase [Oscillibacter sp.]|nr:N-acetylmuramoyl-L-alanine amidase [Oscillibacter sp.]
MIFVIHKRVFLLAGLFICFVAGLGAVLWYGGKNAVAPVFSPSEDAQATVIIDPGHGGVDGGAVSSDGVEEADINLAVALRLNDLLRFAGQNTLMTRTEDVSIYTEGETIRAKKASDMRNRVALVNGTEGALLISVHQNSLPSSTTTHGAQVFWNRQEGAEELADGIQESLNESINQGNEKQAARIPATIYLMKNITAPGVIVECGFLSNPQEAQKLREPAYQTRLAAAIAAGYLRLTAEAS